MAPEIFYSYAPSEQDEELRAELEKQLTQLQRLKLITTWSKHDILAGQQRRDQIEAHVRSAQIILVLVSPDLMASKENFNAEIAIAMERQRKGEAIVIPILLRTVDWSRAPFGGLAPLPSNGVPVKKWPDRDEAFADVAAGIRKIIETYKFDAAASGKDPAPISEKNLPRQRVLDAAVPSHVVKDRATELRVLIRLPESEGLRGVLQKDREAASRPKDVRSSDSFGMTFPTGPTGKLEPLKVTVRLTSPDFSPPTQQKNIFVPPDGDTRVQKFLLTPTTVGKLRVVVELEWRDAVEGDRSLVTMCVSSEAEAPAEEEFNLVQMHVNVRASEASTASGTHTGITPAPLPPPSRHPPDAPTGSHRTSDSYDSPPPDTQEWSADWTKTRTEGREGHESGHASPEWGAQAIPEAALRSPWLAAPVLAALVTAFSALVVGYWQWVYKPAHSTETLKDVVLTGQVLSSRDADFVRGARVNASLEGSPRQFEQFTDSTGGFSIPLGEAKKGAAGRISVHQPKFQELEKNFTVTGQSVRLDLRLDAEDVPLRPELGSKIIAGRIVDAAKNTGLGQVAISLTGRTEYARTDDNGNFRMQVNPPFPREGVRLQVKRAGCTTVDQTVRPPAENLVLELRCTAAVQ